MSRTALPMLLTVILMCAGCPPPVPLLLYDAPPRQEAMTAVLLQLPIHQSPSTVAVSVLGGRGRDISAMGGSAISDEVFDAALRQSITRSKLFARALKDGPAKYQLQAFIAQLNQPFYGVNSPNFYPYPMSVSMEVDYTLSRTESKQIMWQKAVTSSYTATSDDSGVPRKRLQLATEGAARNNIEQAIQEISQLRLE